nr:SIR2 family protein [Methylobacterium sp. L1A1]
MAGDATFMDEPHVARIAAALWSRTPVGNAAILVGAGFSRNARAISSGMRVLPGWDDICRHIVDALLPGVDKRSVELNKRQKAQLGATSTYLRLAQEFEAEFRRDALDQLIKRYVPDLQFAPDQLHRLLLDLPWADVLTTNWDTLLERGAELVEERVYDIVRTIHDLPDSRPPRIVKLHGSLPSNRPFIFTEEDFRTYPERFAPFVNLAREATMENLLVLVGFSGDDPNFLYWSGWVRDQLGDHAPLVYLVGALGLTSSKRKMLEQRRIQPVDLSQLPDFGHWAPEKQHENATRWFLERLRAGEPYRRSRWPKPPAPPNPPPRLIKTGTRSDMPKEEPSTLDRDDPAASAIKVVGVWRHNRSLYPGWIVAPRAARSQIWSRTEHMLAGLLQRIEAMPPVERLHALDELNWRLETSLVPLWWQIPRLIQEAIDGILDQPHPPKPEATTVIRSLRFGLLRHAREIGDDERFDELAASLQAECEHRSDDRARVTYERCLRSISQFDYAAAEALISGWTIDGDPFWLVRKAGLLAEIGRADEADRLSNEARVEIRRQTLKRVDDLASWSKEAYVLLMRSAFVGSSGSGGPGRSAATGVQNDSTGSRSQFEERLDILASRGCDAWGELAHFQRELERDPPPTAGPRTVRQGFDLGAVSITRSLFPVEPDLVLERLDALRALRFQEETGLPPSISYYGITRGLFERAAVWLAGAVPYRAIVAYLRVCTYDQDKNFDVIFSRRAVGRLGDREADLLVDRLSALTAYARPLLFSGSRAGSLWIERLRVAVELLSRLALRRTVHAERLFALGLDLYRDRRICPHPWLSRGVYNLVRRSLEAMPREDRARHALDALTLPMAGEPGFENTNLELRDPVLSFDAFEPSVRSEYAELWDEVIARHIAALSVASTRAAAAGRLLRLSWARLLRPAEQAALREALWAWAERSHGVPGGTDLLEWVFTTLPQPEDRPADQALLAILQRKPEDMNMHRWMLNIRSVLSSSRQERRLTLSDELILGLVMSLRTWACSERPSEGLHAVHEEQEAAIRLEASLLFALLARLSLGRENVRSAVELTLPCMRERAYVEAAIPGLVAANLMDRADGISSLRRGLQSDEVERVTCATSAIRDWAEHEDELGEVPAGLWEEIGLAVATRRSTAVASALEVAAYAYRLYPAKISAVVDDLVVDGLRAILVETGPEQNTQDLTYDADHVRSLAALVAQQMLQIDRGDREYLSDWVNVTETDPMPDVRNAFERQWEDPAFQ